MVNILLEAVILFRYRQNIVADYKGYFSALDNVTKTIFLL